MLRIKKTFYPLILILFNVVLRLVEEELIEE